MWAWGDVYFEGDAHSYPGFISKSWSAKQKGVSEAGSGMLGL